MDNQRHNSAESGHKSADGSCQDGLLCAACESEMTHTELVEVQCGHRYCTSCVAEGFKTAIRFDSAYPPRCGSPISVKLARRKLPKSLVQKFEKRRLEITTKDRTYCYACCTLVAPHSIHNGQAIRQECQQRTCVKCKAAWHFGPCADRTGGDVQNAEE